MMVNQTYDSTNKLCIYRYIKVFTWNLFIRMQSKYLRMKEENKNGIVLKLKTYYYESRI